MWTLSVEKGWSEIKFFISKENGKTIEINLRYKENIDNNISDCEINNLNFSSKSLTEFQNKIVVLNSIHSFLDKRNVQLRGLNDIFFKNVDVKIKKVKKEEKW